MDDNSAVLGARAELLCRLDIWAGFHSLNDVFEDADREGTQRGTIQSMRDICLCGILIW